MWDHMGYPGGIWCILGVYGGIGGHLGLCRGTWASWEVYGGAHGATSRHKGQPRVVGASKAVQGTLGIWGTLRVSGGIGGPMGQPGKGGAGELGAWVISEHLGTPEWPWVTLGCMGQPEGSEGTLRTYGAP